MSDGQTRIQADAKNLVGILVTDFDGTITRRDFYGLVRDRLLPAGTPDYWFEYRAGRLTHFEALRRYFLAAESDEATLIELTQAMEIEPDLAACVQALTEARWEVVVVSAGCRWYIDRLFAEAGVQLTVHTNPGQIVEGRLAMSLPGDSPYLSRETGIDKAAVMRDALARQVPVAFAGDGFPDLEPALLVPASRRFARADLADALRERDKAYRPFSRWAEVVDALVNREDWR